MAASKPSVEAPSNDEDKSEHIYINLLLCLDLLDNKVLILHA